MDSRDHADYKRLDLPPPGRETRVRALARRVLHRPPARTLDNEKLHLMQRQDALIDADLAEHQLSQLIEAVLDGGVSKISQLVEVPSVLDDEHVRRVLNKWAAANIDCMADLIEVGDVIRHAPETISNEVLELFATTVADSRASVARSLAKA